MSSLVRPSFIKEDVSLQGFNSFRFDAKARYFAIISELSALSDSLRWANAQALSITMLGEGSNLLLTGDIQGLVLINQLKGISLSEQSEPELTVSAGENWHQLVSYCVESGLSGIENLALIPGSAGAAPVQNIGAYGVEVKDVLSQVQVMDRRDASLHWIAASECGFAYRDSLFKRDWAERYFITAIRLTLSREFKAKISYGGLSKRLPESPSLKQVFELVCQVRSEKLPDPSKIGNAGSFFKNPIVNEASYQSILADYPDVVAFSVGDSWKLAAGWLIDKAGWKGHRQDGVGVYDKQALCLVNHGANTALALLVLEQGLKQDILQKFGVLLEREPVQLGDLPSI